MSAPSIEQLKHGDIPFVAANQSGIIVDINAHFETVFGWTSAEIIGQPLSLLLPAFFRDAHHLGFARFSATGNSTVLNHPLNLKAVTKDDREIESEHFIIAERRGEEWLFAATLRPLEPR
ncbi:PAS domain-containing protein [Cyanobacteria bacterium FACHB-63]|nr:PAS domain-containing protein [Cyanobacteria bacterium FACHB-63]